MKLLIFLQCMIVGFVVTIVAAPIAIYQSIRG